LQSLSLHYIECAIHHERDVRNEQYTNICGMNKEKWSDLVG